LDHGVRDILGVARGTMDHGRGHREQKVKSGEKHSGLFLDNASSVDRFTPWVEDRQIDPREPWIESSAPDHGIHVERAAVLEQWLAVFCTDGLCDACNAGLFELHRPRPDERRTTMRGCVNASAHRRL
jgi:hypothetical protein